MLRDSIDSYTAFGRRLRLRKLAGHRGKGEQLTRQLVASEVSQTVELDVAHRASVALPILTGGFVPVRTGIILHGHVRELICRS